MRGRAAWRRTLEVKERYLAAGDPDRLPPPACGVRREIVQSWRRSLLSGVDAAATDLPRDAAAVPPERLIRAARPVVDRLADQLTGMRAWAFLADRECRLVRRVVGDPALTPRLEARGAFPGARFSEDVVGTNGLGTAVEQRGPFIVTGSEHYRAYESGATTAGAPVRDPVTRRLVGLLNVNCRYEHTNELLLPFVVELARAIEDRLLATGSVAEQALLAEVTRMSRRCSQAAVVVGEGVFVANSAALSLLDGADAELLRQWARDVSSCGRERAGRLRLGPGLAVTARCRPLSATSRHPAALITLAAAAAPVTTTGGTPGTSSWDRLLRQLDQARAARLPVLIRGERGTGKTLLARRLGAGGPFTVLDAAVAGRAWTERLRGALAEPAGTVLLQHLDMLDPALAMPAASLIASAKPRLAATMCAGGDGVLAERFPVVVDVPPLRERIADLPALVEEIIAELRPQRPRPRCAPAALAALAGHEWPGNVRQLRQVVTTALVRSMSCDITVDDLPDGCAAAGRGLTRLELAERQALMTALRNARWDREAAARELGISRATIYRKLKRLGIRQERAAE